MELDRLELLQNDAYYRLLGDEYLAPVSMLREQYSTTTDENGNVISEVEDISVRVINQLAVLNERAGKSGACVVVMMPEVEAGNPSVPGLDATLVLRLRCLVNPLFNNGENGTKRSEGQIALRAAVLFGHWSPFGNPLYLAPKVIVPANGDVPEGINAYDVELRVRTGVSSGTKVAKPTVSEDGGLCTIVCETLGATIRYTLDGSAPSAGNPNALEYVGPFAVQAGDYVRAAASKAGAFESDTTSGTIS